MTNLHVQAMESRVLLSAYTLSQLGNLGINASGATPQSTLVVDASGNLYGTASAGGQYGAGTVFEVARGSNATTTLASFNGTNGLTPAGALAADGLGNLYGTTLAGGASNYGTVFELAKGSNAITTLASFNGDNGATPLGGVTLDGTGNLWGTTKSGGPLNDGTVFELVKATNTLTAAAYFNGYNGANPYAAVTWDSAGNLFGTAYAGGAKNNGTVFEIAKGSNVITPLASFTATQSPNPECAVTLDGSGNLFGTTNGAPSGEGSVFELVKGSSTITVIDWLYAPYGTNPEAGLTADAAGDLYGTCYANGAGQGTVFEIPKGSTAISTVYDFASPNGAGPDSAVTFDASGNLYGVTRAGGAGDEGTVFEIANGSQAISTLASFTPTNGKSPNAVAVDGSGNVFGTTNLGGSGDRGTLFEILNGTSTVTTLALFDATTGYSPNGGLTPDTSGNLFGTTQLGGPGGEGTVVELPKGSTRITTVASFSSANYPYGAAASGALAFDAAGNLYGTTNDNAARHGGTVFEIAKGSNAITLLASISTGYVFSGIAVDAFGDVYGKTLDGGTSNSGSVFEIPGGSGTVTTLASFNGTNGLNPNDVMLDGRGNIYGTTSFGGANNDGTVFEIANGSGTITTLTSFGSGLNPRGSLTLDASGDLFGTTVNGGANNDGTVFELPEGSNVLATLVSFSGTDGMNPYTALTPDGRGNLYGTTYRGGVAGAGNVFELVPNSAVTLVATTGSNPSSSSQPLVFTATVTGGVPDGETVTLVDAGNNNVVEATGSLSGGSTRLTIPAGTLLAGTHNLVAVYGGDANFAASESASYAQVVQVAVTVVTANGNLPTLAGVQRSMVDSIVYTFSEAVNVGANAFDIAVHSGQSGTAPTLNWAALNPNVDGSSSQWVVTFSGAGVTGGSIADGVYDVTLNAAAVTSDANPSVSAQPRPMDTFYRLFGDAQGTGKVNTADYDAFLSTYGLKSTSARYLGYFADDGGTKIDSADYNAFLANYGKKLSGFIATI